MTATLRLSRRWGSVTDRDRPWQIMIDGTVVGPIAKQQTVDVPVEPGRHTLRVTSSKRFLSRERSFEAADEQVASFWCRSQLLWPMYVASLIKPDLWISLRQD